MHHNIILSFISNLCVCYILRPIILRSSLILTKWTRYFILWIVFIRCLILTFWWNRSCIGFFNPKEIFLIFFKLVIFIVISWIFLSENIIAQEDPRWFVLVFLIYKFNLTLYNKILIKFCSVLLRRFYLSLCVIFLFCLLRWNRRSILLRFELNGIGSQLTELVHKVWRKSEFFNVLHGFQSLNVKSFCILF